MDVKAVNRAEEAVQESEALTRSILENAFDAIISMDATGDVTTWNHGAEIIFGWSADEIIGKKLVDTIIPHQYREAHTNGFRDFLSTGNSRVLNQVLELKALHRKGHDLSIEISISATKWDKSFIFTGIIRDISERKAAQEQAQLKTEDYKILHDVAKALHNSGNMESMLKNAVEALVKSSEGAGEYHAGIFLADAESKALGLFASIGDFRQEFLKREKDTPFGDCLYMKSDCPENIAANATCFINPSREKEFQSMPKPGAHIIPLKRQNNLVGVLFIYEDHDAPWHGRNNEILLSIGGLIADAIEKRRTEEKVQQQMEALADDSAKRKEIEEKLQKQNVELASVNDKLRELNECKNKLLRIAAHDLRNPLYVIRSYSEILMDPSFQVSSADEKKFLGKIFGSSEQMRGLLDNLLDFSSIESGKLRLNKNFECLNTIVQIQVELHKMLANKKDIRLVLAQEPVPPLSFDKNAVIQAITNFISNAIKFSPHGTEIKVSVECRRDYARFAVQDEGPGLTEEEQKLAFAEFQTLSAKPTGGEKSTGLGLAIVKKIINLHCGEVGVFSKPERGANFYFTLPL